MTKRLVSIFTSTVAPVAIFALMPKCPICLAADVAVVGAAFTSWIGLGVFGVTVLGFTLFRLARRKTELSECCK